MDTIIIDDEERALDMLEFHLESYFQDYVVIARYSDIHEALLGILKKKPEVIFMDINMPSGSGVELLMKIKHLKCKVIFLTAHSEYAIEAIKHEAFDYLLKPINLEEFNRVDNKIRNSKTNNDIRTSKKIKIQISNQVYLFNISEILFARSEGNYTTIYSTTQNPIILSNV